MTGSFGQIIAQWWQNTGAAWRLSEATAESISPGDADKRPSGLVAILVG
jgi:hypothetical protein